jgi:hypothetical protein
MTIRTPDCPHCGIGHLKSNMEMFSGVIEGTVITQPMPCWTCDVCEFRAWDDGALSDLEAKLGLNPNGTYRAKGVKSTPRDGELVDQRRRTAKGG